MIERESTVLFFRDLYKTLKTLEDTDAGILMKALFAHANNIDPEGLDRSPIAAALYIGIADQIDRMEEYRNKKAQNRSNRNKTEQTGTNENKQERTGSPYPSPCPSPLLPSSNEEGRKRFAPPTATEVAEYAAEKGIQIDAQRFVDFYASKGWKVGSTPMKDWKAAARNWAARDRTEKPSKDAPVFNFDQRHTDYDALVGW